MKIIQIIGLIASVIKLTLWYSGDKEDWGLPIWVTWIFFVVLSLGVLEEIRNY